METIRAICNPNYTHTYVAKESPWHEKLTYNWVNFSQFVLSTHCASNARFSMEPIARGRIEGRNDYGTSTATLKGRMAHLALTTVLLAVAAYSFPKYKYLTGGLFVGLLSTKLMSNFYFRKDRWLDIPGEAEKIYEVIKDPYVQDKKGWILLFEAMKEFSQGKFEKMLGGCNVDTVDAYGYTMLLQASIDNPAYVPLILKYNPNVRLKVDFNECGLFYNALDLAAKVGAFTAVEALLKHQNGKAFSREEIEAAITMTEEKNRMTEEKNRLKNQPGIDSKDINFEKTKQLLTNAIKA